MGNQRRVFFEAKYFGFVIGFLVVVLLLLLKSFSVFNYLDMVVLDSHMNLRSTFASNTLKVGVTEYEPNPNISPDILIVGVDTRSLDRFGKWPWPRYRHADFLNTLSRIKNQAERERAIMLDFFFIEKSTQPEQDALLAQAIAENGRVVLETVLEPQAGDEEMLKNNFARLKELFKTQAPLQSVSGSLDGLIPYYGMEIPILPVVQASSYYGHPNFNADADQTFRRQELVIRVSELLERIDVASLDAGFALEAGSQERLDWIDRDGAHHWIELPLNADKITRLEARLKDESPAMNIDTDEDGVADREVFVINRYKDYFLPSITLMLALNYFNVPLSSIEVVIGEHIKIKDPKRFNPSTQSWDAYTIETKAAEYQETKTLVKAGEYAGLAELVLHQLGASETLGTSDRWSPLSYCLTPPEFSSEISVIRPAEYRTVDELTIPIDKGGSMLINYMGKPSGDSTSQFQTYPVRSYASYASRATGPDAQAWPPTLALSNKIIMAGIFSQGTATDEKQTPFGIMYGIEMHANALNTILMDKFIHPFSAVQNAILLLLVCMLVAFFTSRLKTPLALGVTVLALVAYYLSAALLFDFQAILIDFAVPVFGMFITMIGIIVYRVMTEEKEKKRIQSMFGKYVSKTVVDQMVESGNQPELGGVDKELTVLFSDIRGFTTLSEAMTPQELVNHLNTYLTAMTDIILEDAGTLDKYVGDEVMCFWGAPVPQNDHALRACRCALKQMARLAELNEAWPPERRIDIGIGINSGIMTVGNMGSIGRMNYTLMGDNVNLGARLEGTNKQYGTHIIMSEFTYALVKDKVIARELDNIRVKGKNKPVMIYELIDMVD